MICPTCRSEIKDGSNFCIKCGARLGESPAPGVSQPPAQAPVDAYNAPPAATDALPGAGEFVIKPLGFGQLFDAGIKLYLRYFKYIVGTAAVVLIPMHLLSYLVQFAMPFPSPETAAEFNPGSLFAFIPMMLMLGLFAIITMTLQQGAIISIVSNIYLGQEPSIGKAYSAAGRRIVVLIVSGLLYLILVWVGSIFCVIPGIYLGVLLLLYPHTIMLENKGIIESIQRSSELIKGNWFKLFAVVLLVWIFSFVISAALNVPLGFMAASGNTQAFMRVTPVSALIQAIVQLIVTPFASIVTILFYYDLRVRKEGYNLEIMAREIGR